MSKISSAFVFFFLYFISVAAQALVPMIPPSSPGLPLTGTALLKGPLTINGLAGDSQLQFNWTLPTIADNTSVNGEQHTCADNFNGGSAATSYVAICLRSTINATGNLSNVTGTQDFLGGNIVTIDGRTTNGSGWQQTLASVGQGFDSCDYYGGSGFLARAMNTAGIPYVQITRGSDKISGWVTRDYSRISIIAATGASSILDEFGINDMNSGATAAQIEAYQTYVGKQLSALPNVKGVYLTTLTPDTTSTDGFVTTTNQTSATGNTTVGVTYNTWVRTTPSPFAGYFDVEAKVATSPTARLWTPNPAQVNYLTPEGIHMTPYGHALAATAISNNAGILR